MKFIHILSFVCLFYEVINRKTKRSKNKREYFKYVTTPGHKITDISDFYFEFDPLFIEWLFDFYYFISYIISLVLG